MRFQIIDENYLLIKKILLQSDRIKYDKKPNKILKDIYLIQNLRLNSSVIKTHFLSRSG